MPVTVLAEETTYITIGDWTYGNDGNWTNSNNTTVTTLYFDALGKGTITDCGKGYVSSCIKDNGELEITLNNTETTDGLEINNPIATSTIIVNGNNTINSKSIKTVLLDSDNYIFSYGIIADSNLIIKGANESGDSLNVTTNDGSEASVGIWLVSTADSDTYYDFIQMENVSLNITSGAAIYQTVALLAKNITIKGCINATASECIETSHSSSAAIMAYYKLTVENSAVINAWSGNSNYCSCLMAYDFSNNGDSNIKLVTQNTLENSVSYGLWIFNQAEILAGSFDIDIKAAGSSCGINSGNLVNISGGTYNIDLSSNNYSDSIGLYSNILEISNATFEKLSINNPQGLSIGVHSSNDLEISNSTFQDIDVINSLYSRGISNDYNDIIIDNSNITIHDKNNGIFAKEGSVIIGTNSDIEIYDEGNEYESEGCAIYGNEDVSIKDIKVLASSENGYGIFANENITIDYSEVTMTSNNKYALSATNFNLLNAKAYMADNSELIDYSNEKYIKTLAVIEEDLPPVTQTNELLDPDNDNTENNVPVKDDTQPAPLEDDPIEDPEKAPDEEPITEPGENSQNPPEENPQGEQNKEPEGEPENTASVFGKSSVWILGAGGGILIAAAIAAYIYRKKAMGK